MRGRTEVLTMVQVTGIVQLTASAVYDKIARGEFPRPLKRGVRSYWRADDSERHLQERAADIARRREALRRAAQPRGRA